MTRVRQCGGRVVALVARAATRMNPRRPPPRPFSFAFPPPRAPAALPPPAPAPPRAAPRPATSQGYPTIHHGGRGRPRIPPFPAIAHAPPPKPVSTWAWCIDHELRVDAEAPEHAHCDLVIEARDASGRRKGLRSKDYGELSRTPMQRLRSGFAALDRFVGDRTPGGDGWVWNSVTMLAGKPGSGKSTLLAQLAEGFERSGLVVLSCTGEEAPDQVAWRALRLGANPAGVRVLVTTAWDEVVEETAHLDPDVVIVDSAQVMEVFGAYGGPGSMAQVDALGAELTRLAKGTGRMVIVVGQFTKDGDAAGTMRFQHIVDTMLFYDVTEDGLRTLRSPKNRFGMTNDFLALEMTRQGLREVDAGRVDPAMLDAARDPGVVIFPAVVGPRVVLTRVDALVSEIPDGETRAVTAKGYPIADLRRVLTALAKNSYLPLSKRSVSVEVSEVAGEPVRDRALDLAVATAVLSSAIERPAPPAFGRLALAGGVEGVERAKDRVDAVLAAGLMRPLAPPKVGRASNVAHLRDLLATLAPGYAIPATTTPRDAPQARGEARGAPGGKSDGATDALPDAQRDAGDGAAPRDESTA